MALWTRAIRTCRWLFSASEIDTLPSPRVPLCASASSARTDRPTAPIPLCTLAPDHIGWHRLRASRLPASVPATTETSPARWRTRHAPPAELSCLGQDEIHFAVGVRLLFVHGRVPAHLLWQRSVYPLTPERCTEEASHFGHHDSLRGVGHRCGQTIRFEVLQQIHRQIPHVVYTARCTKRAQPAQLKSIRASGSYRLARAPETLRTVRCSHQSGDRVQGILYV